MARGYEGSDADDAETGRRQECPSMYTQHDKAECAGK